MQSLIYLPLNLLRLHVPLHASVAAFPIDKTIVLRPQYIITLCGWILFNLYWELAKGNASEATASENKISRSLHVLLVNMALIMVIAPIHGFARLVPVSPWLMTAGVIIELSGLALAVWARLHLAHHWSGAITIKAGHELIRSGPYEKLRHPIYSGILGMYAGTALVNGEWLAFMGFALALIAYWRKIGLEETSLMLAFGDEYRAYRSSSWALVYGLL